MIRTVLYLTLPLISLLMAAGCMSTPPTQGSPVGNPAYVNLGDITFTAESVAGEVQIKANRNAPWHDLMVGEVFDGYALIRTGFRSLACLIMKDGNRELRCDIDGLICEISMSDVYNKILSPSGVDKYNKKYLWTQDDLIDPDAPVLVCRSSLNGEDPDEGSLLAEANFILNMKSQQLGGGGGAQGAASGSAPGGGGGSGGSGGGCGPGG